MQRMSEYENQQALRMIDTQDLISKPKNIRDKYDFLRVEDIDSLAIANAIQNYHKAWRNYHKIGYGIPTFHKKRSSWSYQTNCQYIKQDAAYLDNGTVRFIDAKHVKLPKLGIVRIAGLRKLIKKRLFNRIPTRISIASIKKKRQTISFIFLYSWEVILPLSKTMLKHKSRSALILTWIIS